MMSPTHWRSRRPPALLLLLLLLADTGAAAQQACPGSHLTAMATIKNYSYPGVLPPTSPALDLLVCEDLSRPNGSITFVLAPGQPADRAHEHEVITLPKRVYANTVENDDVYLGNMTKQQVMSAPTDIMGNFLLGAMNPLSLPSPSVTHTYLRACSGHYPQVSTATHHGRPSRRCTRCRARSHPSVSSTARAYGPPTVSLPSMPHSTPPAPTMAPARHLLPR